MASQTFAVTGGTGFLGMPLVRELVALGAGVRVLTRRAESDEAIVALGATPVRGDLLTDGGWDDLCADGDTVIHAAARVGASGRWKDYHELTVTGTERLLAAALPHRPARFVYVSSAGVYGPMPAGHVYCADTTPAEPTRDNWYGRAKLEAENAVRRACDDAGVPWTILRLCTVTGPGAWMIEDALRSMSRFGRIRTIGDGTNRFATVYVDDAVRAIVLAATHPAAANRVYDVVNDEPVTQREFLAGACAALGLPAPGGSIPPLLARGGAWVAEAVVPLFGLRKPLARGFVTLMLTDQRFDVSRLREDTGWTPQVSFDEGMRRFGEAYRARRASAGEPARSSAG